LVWLRPYLTKILLVSLDILQGTYLETDGLVVAEAEHYTDLISSTTHAWLTSTVLSGYEGSSYLHALPDIDVLIPTEAITDSPTTFYPIHFTTPGTYTVWSRAYADNADADAMYVGLDGQVTNVTGFEPEAWDWANQQMPGGEPATLSIETSGVYTLTAAMYEDGLRLDRLLLTTDTTYLPTSAGPAETPRQAEVGGPMTTLTRTVVYTYDHLYRLTEADYSTGEYYNYTYDAVGNRVGLNETTLISGTLVTTYTFDAANRLTDRAVSDGRVYTYTWSAKGEMLEEWTVGYPVRTFTYNAAGQMIEATVFTLTTVFTYNGDGVRVAMAVDGHGATTYALDYAGNNRILAETTGGGTTQYLYSEAEQECLAEVADGEWDYYLSDMSGQVRQLADEAGEISSTWLYDPDGMVLEGPEGLVSHLICGGVYDWSTGLIYKGGRYFDPNLGIWLMMMPLAVMSLWHGRRRRGGFSGFTVLLVVVCVSGLVVGCGGGSTPTPIPTPCIKIEPFNSKVYPNLDDTFLFVSPDPDPIPGWNFTYGNQIVWAEDDKEVARDTFEKILTRLTNPPHKKGFGSLQNLARELKFSTTKPVWLIRTDGGTAGGSPAAGGYGPDYSHVYFFVPFFEKRPPEAPRVGVLTHELAHIWDGAYGNQLRLEMRAFKNWGTSPWGEQLELEDFGTAGEDFAESFNFYFWPEIDRNQPWTDDFGKGLEWANQSENGARGIDGLRLDSRGNLTADPNGEQVRDRYDWFENRLTGTWH
jgi:hypothetical protein